MECTNNNACTDTTTFLTTTAASTTKRKHDCSDRAVVSPDSNDVGDKENTIHKRLRTTNDLAHSECTLIESSSPILMKKTQPRRKYRFLGKTRKTRTP
mmetsp:Transcript_26984/g.65496  ORF Transcript_26984/g.65496 Transcript_26984/m.65496 type:complete len:98 (+) Transcript_26984:561-854(+)